MLKDCRHDSPPLWLRRFLLTSLRDTICPDRVFLLWDQLSSSSFSLRTTTLSSPFVFWLQFFPRNDPLFPSDPQFPVECQFI